MQRDENPIRGRECFDKGYILKSDWVGNQILKCHPELVSGSYNNAAFGQPVQVGS